MEEKKRGKPVFEKCGKSRFVKKKRGKPVFEKCGKSRFVKKKRGKPVFEKCGKSEIFEKKRGKKRLFDENRGNQTSCSLSIKVLIYRKFFY
jgi:hypothetical protein